MKLKRVAKIADSRFSLLVACCQPKKYGSLIQYVNFNVKAKRSYVLYVLYDTVYVSSIRVAELAQSIGTSTCPQRATVIQKALKKETKR